MYVKILYIYIYIYIYFFFFFENVVYDDLNQPAQRKDKCAQETLARNAARDNSA
jgi:hypothetical protein